jgi:DNA polymerase
VGVRDDGEEGPAPVPETRSLSRLREAAQACRACELWRPATQVVFGEGPARAGLVLIGEQPGDREDLAGEPFVGPAGRVLDAALAEAGIDRASAYLTNAVKHFRFRERGKRRIHERPGRSHMRACAPWWRAELRAIRPRAVGLLGAVAAEAVLGRQVRVTRDRGVVAAPDLAELVVLTVHPSAILRSRDAAGRAAAMAGFVEDLRLLAPDGAARR